MVLYSQKHILLLPEATGILYVFPLVNLVRTAGAAAADAIECIATGEPGARVSHTLQLLIAV
ncbi:hypothetical protein CSA37_00935 [Candidatus Fermentibacteria bacterium]|nr:MAG: hypothetical protein CSA37_00935 [Candidatus Fermentibacteria bacterium]